MPQRQKNPSDEVDQLMRNAQLRDELEPYLDEAICRVNVRAFSTPKENEFLASMLAWERAPVLPIGDWFQPRLTLPHPDEFAQDEDGESALHQLLWEAIYRLYEKRIVLDFTEHLSDRQLYCLIYRDILPSQEKKLDEVDSYLHWDCADASGNPDIWLCYYASDREREEWAEEYDEAPTAPHVAAVPPPPAPSTAVNGDRCEWRPL